MNDLPRNPTGGVIAACESEEGCQILSCESCLKEIPANTAYGADVQDYVHHFCGLDCFDAWQKKSAKAQTDDLAKK